VKMCSATPRRSCECIADLNSYASLCRRRGFGGHCLDNDLLPFAARFGVANGGVDQRWGLIGLDLDKFFLFLKIIFFVG
jgi:hypothetical protein